MDNPAYEAMARNVIFGIEQTHGPIELDVSSIQNPVLLKKIIQDKGYDVADTMCNGRQLFLVSLLKRRIYPILYAQR